MTQPNKIQTLDVAEIECVSGGCNIPSYSGIWSWYPVVWTQNGTANLFPGTQP